MKPKLLERFDRTVRSSLGTIDKYVETLLTLAGLDAEYPIAPDIPQTFRYQPNHVLIRHRLMEEFARKFEGTNRYNLSHILERTIDEFQENLSGAVISVSFRDFHNRYPDFNVNGDKAGWSASTIKVPVMIEVYRAIDRGELGLEDTLEVDHKYTLEPYDRISTLDAGEKVPILDLIDAMIISSDNEATNMLADRVGLERINDTMQELGATRTMMAHLLAPRMPRLYTDWNVEGSNLVTANDLTLLMEGIYKGKAASPESCRLMVATLEKANGGMLSSFLPSGTRVGHKIGIIADPSTGDDILDVGVINGDYAITVLCNRIGYKRIRGEEVRMCQPQDARRAIAYWAVLEKTLDAFHRYAPTPFYFEVQARPVFYYKPSEAPEIIGAVSRVIHDIYYKGELQLKK